jgi:hypothetical protein
VHDELLGREEALRVDPGHRLRVGVRVRVRVRVGAWGLGEG